MTDSTYQTSDLADTEDRRSQFGCWAHGRHGRTESVDTLGGRPGGCEPDKSSARKRTGGTHFSVDGRGTSHPGIGLGVDVTKPDPTTAPEPTPPDDGLVSLTYRYLRIGMTLTVVAISTAAGIQARNSGGSFLGSISAYYYSRPRSSCSSPRWSSSGSA